MAVLGIERLIVTHFSGVTIEMPPMRLMILGHMAPSIVVSLV